MKENILKSAEELIASGKLSLAVIKDGRMLTACARGIAPLVEMYENGALEGAAVVDKIIGMAAAKILVLGGAESCLGLVMSRSAYEYLRKNGICVEYRTLTESIQNREGTGVCPMERAVADKEKPADALAAIKEKLAEFRAKTINFE